jgi:peptide/nickel transport system ATP-binding protein
MMTAAAQDASVPVVKVDGLSVHSPAHEQPVVDRVHFELEAGRCLAVVGESGSGKSVMLRALVGLEPQDWWATGSVRINGNALESMSKSALRRLRRRDVAFVFQDASSALSPVRTVGANLRDSLRDTVGSRGEIRSESLRLLRQVGIPDPERQLHSYPFELSGGMRQRVMIAMSLAGRPNLLIADEPTSALDVTIQAQIIQLVRELQIQRQLSMIWVSHDLRVVAGIADDVMVMYAGQVLEYGPMIDVLENPKHPYTAGLIACTPTITDPDRRLNSIPGQSRTFMTAPRGCVFWDRCELRSDPVCETVRPELREARPGHWVATSCELSSAGLDEPKRPLGLDRTDVR